MEIGFLCRQCPTKKMKQLVDNSNLTKFKNKHETDQKKKKAIKRQPVSVCKLLGPDSGSCLVRSSSCIVVTPTGKGPGGSPVTRDTEAMAMARGVALRRCSRRKEKAVQSRVLKPGRPMAKLRGSTCPVWEKAGAPWDPGASCLLHVFAYYYLLLSIIVNLQQGSESSGFRHISGVCCCYSHDKCVPIGPAATACPNSPEQLLKGWDKGSFHRTSGPNICFGHWASKHLKTRPNKSAKW